MSEQMPLNTQALHSAPQALDPLCPLAVVVLLRPALAQVKPTRFQVFTYAYCLVMAFLHRSPANKFS